MQSLLNQALSPSQAAGNTLSYKSQNDDLELSVPNSELEKALNEIEENLTIMIDGHIDSETTKKIDAKILLENSIQRKKDGIVHNLVDNTKEGLKRFQDETEKMLREVLNQLGESTTNEFN